MKFYIETYGCQMNVADSELIATILCKAGYEPTVSIDDADLILFNTCSVRAHAEERVLGRISNEMHRKKSKPSLKIGLLGCMAQRMGKSLLDKGVDIVVGVDQYHRLPELLQQVNAHPYLLDFDDNQVYHDLQPTHQGNSCAFVTIMRGCNNFCSYCIVPHVRGRERSRPFRDIHKDVQMAGKQGLLDVTLLGQNVNSYHDGETDFPDLLKELNNIDSINRLRFITSHPKDLTDKLIDVMASCAKVCNHIHIPMQSGNSRILSLMNRGYSAEHYLALVRKLRNNIPDIAITTDIIVGFPGETDSEFQDTLLLMEQIGFDYAFCFKFSPRDGTKAATMPDQISEESRLERLKRMIDLQRRITLDKFRSKIGHLVEVYVEDFSKKSRDMVSGKTRDFKIAVLPGSESDIGSLKTARVISATAGTLICS